MRRFVVLLIAIFALVVAGKATTVIPMSVEELSRAADTVVEARVLDSWTQWNPQHTVIYTYTRLQVVKVLKGAPSQQLVVKQPGGIVGSYGMTVPGVRHFQVGEDAVLFLRPSAANDGSNVVVGLMQGNFRMYKSRSGLAVTNGVPGVSTLSGGSVRVYTGTAMSLQNMESLVQGALTR